VRNSTHTSNYVADSVNAYTSETDPGVIPVAGTANPASTVTVNSQTPVWQNNYFFKEISVNNSAGAVYQNINIQATLTPNSSSKQGNFFVPAANVTPTYDNDGNLLTDGRWEYTWDAENRLTRIETQTALLTLVPGKRLDFTYDYKHRRTSKKVYNWNGSAYVLSTHTKFIYDGWQLLAEIDASNNLIRSYTWGLDLSRSEGGAGHVGGLLAMEDGTDTWYYSCDGNGNITSLVNASTGTEDAEYDYGPFGENVNSYSNVVNPFQFSSIVLYHTLVH